MRFSPIFLCLTLALDPSIALAETPKTPIHVEVSSVLSTGVESLSLPPGYFFTDAEFGKLDAEVHRLQLAEVSLTAERDNYKKNATTNPPTSRVVLVSVIAFVTGAAIATVAALASR